MFTHVRTLHPESRPPVTLHWDFSNFPSFLVTTHNLPTNLCWRTQADANLHEPSSNSEWAKDPYQENNVACLTGTVCSCKILCTEEMRNEFSSLQMESVMLRLSQVILPVFIYSPSHLILLMFLICHSCRLCWWRNSCPRVAASWCLYIKEQESYGCAK